MIRLFSATRLVAAASVLTLAAGIAAAPVSFDVGSNGLSIKSASAFAKHGADDPAGDDRGGTRHGGGKGRGGHDDGPNHQ